MFEHTDVLTELNKHQSLNKKLSFIHQVLKEQFNFIDRIAVASYDAKTDMLKSFIASTDIYQPAAHYSSLLSETPSLVQIIKLGLPRVVNNLSLFNQGTIVNINRIKAQKYNSYAASYTMPMYLNGVFWGFIFFNSYCEDCFNDQVLNQIDIYGHLISSITTNEIASIKTLLAALKTANEMVHYRDPETGGHLDRMARYARLIAQQLTIDGKYSFNDEYIEHLFLFAPLHDIGKIGIADNILLKPGKLNDSELAIMQTHAIKGTQLIDAMMKNFGLEAFDSVNVLRNIAEFHHEALDGSGYPLGLKGEQIPIEARIIAVADVYDALTSKRPYKQAWSNDEAFAMLQRLATAKLDQDCVDALIKNRDKVEELQKLFRDENSTTKQTAAKA